MDVASCLGKVKLRNMIESLVFDRGESVVRGASQACPAGNNLTLLAPTGSRSIQRIPYTRILWTTCPSRHEGMD